LRRSLVVLWIGMLLALGACSFDVGRVKAGTRSWAIGPFRPLLYDVSVSDATISPNADGDTDVARIEYKLARNATLSIYLVDGQGHQHYFRRERPRSRTLGGQTYRVDFGGVIPREIDGLRQDRALPDGEYTLVLEATDERGRPAVQEFAFGIVDADTAPPQLQGFSLDRHVFTPNRDGVDDRVKIVYYLTKEASTSVYLVADGQDTIKYPIERDPSSSATKDGEIGPYYYDYEGGVDKGAEPPPDGVYTVVAFAEDRVGNKTTVTDTLEIRDGGVPRGTIVGLEWDVSDTVVPIGGTLYFTATVENYGATPIRTTGPEPGTEYTTDWNFATLGEYVSSGAFRMGIGYDNCPIGDYPWRWSVGRYEGLTAVQRGGETLYYLEPGQRALVYGSIRILSAPPRNPTPFWAGLIHEDVEIVNPRVDPKWITVDVEPTGPWGDRATPTPMVKSE
jgi:hypothetical protein